MSHWEVEAEAEGSETAVRPGFAAERWLLEERLGRGELPQQQPQQRRRQPRSGLWRSHCHGHCRRGDGMDAGALDAPLCAPVGKPTALGLPVGFVGKDAEAAVLVRAGAMAERRARSAVALVLARFRLLSAAGEDSWMPSQDPAVAGAHSIHG